MRREKLTTELISQVRELGNKERKRTRGDHRGDNNKQRIFKSAKR